MQRNGGHYMSGSTSNANFIGSGSDTITLNMSEDQAAGQDAQFTVNVDGQQIGGVQTVTASHAAGQDQTFTFAGNYGPGAHNVVVTFGNNFIFPGTSGDRNLYVDGVNYDGQTISNSTTPIYQAPLFPPNSTVGDISGNAVFGVNDTTSIPAGAGPNETTTPGAVSVGSGADTLVLNMAEDAFQGDAQFTVSVDGKQIGGTQTTTAILDQGQQQEFDVHGDFGGGNHTVSVNFLNDQIGGFFAAGTPGLPPGQWAIDTTDRNLYVMSASLDGGANASGAPWELSSSGSHDFFVSAGSNQSATGSGTQASTANTASITTDSLNASSTGMSFLASPATDTGAGSTGTGSTGTGTAAATDSSASASSTVGAATQTAADFVAPTTGSSGTDTTNPGSASTGNWWMDQSAANIGVPMFQQG
jgi:Ca-dependent carbohydrate-binding module xylan-binding